MTRVLIVLTSHSELGDTGERTGFWLEELAAPYYRFQDAGWDLTLASPLGGRPPLDPKSNDPEFRTEDTRRFEEDADAQAQLDATTTLTSVSADDFDVVFFPGGHGPMWDLAEDSTSKDLIERFDRLERPVGLVCHAPGALRHVRAADGAPLVAGRRITGFTNAEEDGVGLTSVVPFLVEDELKSLGAEFASGDDWQPFVLVDGRLVTGQNPASSGPAAQKLIEVLEQSG